MGGTDFGAASPSAASGLRYRAGITQPPSQEIPNLGTVPKRTESLYMKYGPEAGMVKFFFINLYFYIHVSN